MAHKYRLGPASVMGAGPFHSFHLHRLFRPEFQDGIPDGDGIQAVSRTA